MPYHKDCYLQRDYSKNKDFNLNEAEVARVKEAVKAAAAK